MSNNLYIPLEEVEKFIKTWVSGETFFNNAHSILSSLKSLPTIDLSVIDEMIEDKESPTYCLTGKYSGIPMFIEGEIHALQELKSRLSHNQ